MNAQESVTPSVERSRWALRVQYDGRRYMGWQRLRHGPSVQAALEASLSRVVDEPVVVHCAGRTDAGVHARGQIVHFDTTAARSRRALTLGVNSNLPDDIAVTGACAVAPDFHARFSAIAREYRYTILTQAYPEPLQPFVWVVHHRLDVDAMNEAVSALLGEYDFSSFRAAGCQAKHAVRRLLRARMVAESSRRLVFDIAANAFLHHMVRNIVGSLVLIGRGEREVNWLARLLSVKDRRQAGPTAPATGLLLSRVRYPIELQFDEDI